MDSYAYASAQKYRDREKETQRETAKGADRVM